MKCCKGAPMAIFFLVRFMASLPLFAAVFPPSPPSLLMSPAFRLPFWPFRFRRRDFKCHSALFNCARCDLCPRRSYFPTHSLLPHLQPLFHAHAAVSRPPTGARARCRFSVALSCARADFRVFPASTLPPRYLLRCLLLSLQSTIVLFENWVCARVTGQEVRPRPA